MVDYKDLLSIPFYKKSAYTGSLGKMNYKIERNAEDDSKFKIYVWKGPLAFDYTKEEKQIHEEEFSDDGIKKIADWLNEIQETYNA